MHTRPAFCLAALLAAQAAHPAAWRTFTFDGSSKFTGTAVAAGKDGALFVVGVDGNKYVTKYHALRGGAWKRGEIGFTTDQVDMAVDADNNVHIVTVHAYKDKNNPQDLVYTYDDGKADVKQVVLDDNAHYYWVPSLALDKDGGPHVSAYMKFYPDGEPARDLIYFERGSDGKWTGRNLDSSGNETAKFSGIAIDSKLKAHIAYIDVSNGRLHYAGEKDTGWFYNDIGSGNWTRKGSFVRTLVTPDDVPNAVYITEASGSGADTNSVFEIARPDSADGWKTAVLDTMGVFSFAHRFGSALDEDGNVCLAYRKNSDRSLHFLRYKDGKPEIETVDTAGNTGFNASLATAPGGGMYITYTNLKGELMLATTDADYTPAGVVRAGRKAGKGIRLRGGLRGGSGRAIRLEVASEAAAEVRLELRDLRGALAADLGAVSLAEGANTLELPLAGIENGVYLVAVRRGNGDGVRALGTVSLH